jgi:hypothetical protein
MQDSEMNSTGDSRPQPSFQPQEQVTTFFTNFLVARFPLSLWYTGVGTDEPRPVASETTLSVIIGLCLQDRKQNGTVFWEFGTDIEASREKLRAHISEIVVEGIGQVVLAHA